MNIFRETSGIQTRDMLDLDTPKLRDGIHEARLLGTDARLLTPDAPESVDGKLNKVVENVLFEYYNAENEGKTGTQLIFSDIGTPKRPWSREMLNMQWHEIGAFDVYNYIKTEAVRQGIPATARGDPQE